MPAWLAGKFQISKARPQRREACSPKGKLNFEHWNLFGL